MATPNDTTNRPSRKLTKREYVLLTAAARDCIPDWCYQYFKPQIQDTIDDLVLEGLLRTRDNSDYLITPAGRAALESEGK